MQQEVFNSPLQPYHHIICLPEPKGEIIDLTLFTWSHWSTNSSAFDSAVIRASINSTISSSAAADNNSSTLWTRQACPQLLRSLLQSGAILPYTGDESEFEILCRWNVVRESWATAECLSSREKILTIWLLDLSQRRNEVVILCQPDH